MICTAPDVVVVMTRDTAPVGTAMSSREAAGCCRGIPSIR